MFIVGLTGGIATGKTSVAKAFQELGIDVIDADIVARKVVEIGRPALKQIRKEFGDGVLLEDGGLNRGALADVIFSDPQKRKRLDAITHPRIYREIAWEVMRLFIKGRQFIVVELPLLYESAVMVNYIHKVIVVTCNEEQQMERLMKRNNFNKEEAQKRIKAQMPMEEKCSRANFVINNSGDPEDTKNSVATISRVLRSSKFHWKIRLFIACWLLGGTLAFGWLLNQIF